MNITQENYATIVDALSHQEKASFYYSLARMLTIVGRSFYNEDLPIKQSLAGYKTLNEMMHTVLAKADHERLQDHEWKESDIIQAIYHFISFEPFLEPHILWAINQSYKITRANEID